MVSPLPERSTSRARDLSRRALLGGAGGVCVSALIGLDPARAFAQDFASGRAAGGSAPASAPFGAALAPGGSAAILTVQEDLNRRYGGRRDWVTLPLDGIADRRLATGLIFAVQYEIGLADGVANGNFGPATRAGLKAKGLLSVGDQDTDEAFVHLFQAGFIALGYSMPYDGVFSDDVSTAVAAFQSFVALDPSGAGDFSTWASLLVSTGDTERAGAAIDAASTVTTARAQASFEAGYRVVGRYLTNTPVADPLDKRIKPGELDTIFDAGLGVFPIFQEDGTSAGQFSADSGVVHANRAAEAALGYGFRAGTTIYFAVDFDVSEAQIHNRIVPYFRSIRDVFATRSHGYVIGVYGARRLCIVLESEGLALNSFVGDLSTGYEGNLATPLPGNWAFDQILETSVGSGAGAMDIDKNVMSGRDPGQTAVDVRGGFDTVP